MAGLNKGAQAPLRPGGTRLVGEHRTRRLCRLRVHRPPDRRSLASSLHGRNRRRAMARDLVRWSRVLRREISVSRRHAQRIERADQTFIEAHGGLLDHATCQLEPPQPHAPSTALSQGRHGSKPALARSAAIEISSGTHFPVPSRPAAMSPLAVGAGRLRSDMDSEPLGEPDESRRSSVIAAPARLGPAQPRGLQRNSPGRVGSRIRQALGHTFVAAKGQPGRRIPPG
jgi:hypothetical protein